MYNQLVYFVTIKGKIDNIILIQNYILHFYTHSLHTVLRPNITDITITPSPSHNNLLLHEFNDTVSLTCTAEGGPRIMIRWQFDDGSSVETVADGNSSVTYIVSSLSTDHTGVYYCEAIIDGVSITSMNYTLFGEHTVNSPVHILKLFFVCTR